MISSGPTDSEYVEKSMYCVIIGVHSTSALLLGRYVNNCVILAQQCHPRVDDIYIIHSSPAGQ